MTRRSLTLGAMVALVAACAPRPAAETAAMATIDSAAVRTAAQGFWQRWITAALAVDTAALFAMVTDSVRVDSKGMPPLLGKPAFQTFFGSLLQTVKVDAETITPEQTNVISNELAYQTGDFVETTTMAGKTQTEYGRYASAIRKDPDGQWRLLYIMAFPDSTVPVKK